MSGPAAGVDDRGEVREVGLISLLGLVASNQREGPQLVCACARADERGLVEVGLFDNIVQPGHCPRVARDHFGDAFHMVDVRAPVGAVLASMRGFRDLSRIAHG